MSQKTECENFIRRKLTRLAALPANVASAALAQLRRGLSSEPGQETELWEWTIEGLPPELMGNRDSASRAEWAVHVALTLYAFHQQGNDLKINNMDRKECSFGRAVRLISKGDEGEEERVIKRLKVVASADTIQELAYQLRQIVSLLKASAIPFDYAGLSGDLYDFQFEEGRTRVRRKWAQDFYRYEKSETKEE